MPNPKFFAVIPAAGHSRRMGEHKLLMPWIESTVIEHVLSVWRQSKVDEIVVVVRANDSNLIEVLGNQGVWVKQLDVDTADMKESVQQGLRFLESKFSPSNKDCCLIAPADLPNLKQNSIDAVIDSSSGEFKIVVPWYGEKKGHPICFPWLATENIFKLGPDEGLKSLIEREETKRVELDIRLRPRDIDTPKDYWREQGK